MFVSSINTSSYFFYDLTDVTILSLILIHRGDSSFLLQTVYTQWPSGSCVWLILILLIRKEISSLLLLTSSARNSAQYQQLQLQQQQQHQQQQYQLHSSADDGYSVEEREWIAGRDVECLLFMLLSLMDCVCEPSTPPSSLPCPSASSSSSSSSFSFSSFSHATPSSSAHAPSAPYPPPHALLRSPLNNVDSRSSPTFRTANSRPSFQTNQTKNLNSTPQRAWFSDITYVTFQLLEQESVQDEIFETHPAVGIRLLQLWTVMPSPKGTMCMCICTCICICAFTHSKLHL